MELDSIVRRDERAVFRRLDEGEGGVVLHLDTAAYHGVNETGVFVWELLADAPTVSTIIAKLQARYDEPPDTVRADVERFLSALEKRSLVSVLARENTAANGSQ